MANPDIVNYFLFSLSLLTEEELKKQKSLEFCNQVVLDGSRKQKQNCLEKLPWIYWMSQYLMYFFLHATFLYLLVALCLLLRLKSWSVKGASFHPAFKGTA